ncbi:DUF5067 domain-containing protein [Streptococcus dentiloxodontae]
MKVKKLIIAAAVFLFLIAAASAVFSAMNHSHVKNWSFFKKNRTFSNGEIKIRVIKAAKISLSDNENAVRIYYKITNLSSKKDNGYALLLDHTEGIYQDKKEVKSTTVLGQDDEEDLAAINVDIAPKETKEVVNDYKVANLTSAIKIKFLDSDDNTVATYSLDITNLPDAPVYAYDYSMPSLDLSGLS